MASAAALPGRHSDPSRIVRRLRRRCTVAERTPELLLLARLTPRDRDVLRELAQGRSVKEAASALGIRSNTVGVHKTRLMGKLGVHSRAELVRLALATGVVPLRGPAHPD